MALLAQCNEVTRASVNADGVSPPKGHTVECNEVWMATGADSMKVADFKIPPPMRDFVILFMETVLLCAE